MRFPNVSFHGLKPNTMNRETRVDVQPAAFPGASCFEFPA